MKKLALLLPGLFFKFCVCAQMVAIPLKTDTSLQKVNTISIFSNLKDAILLQGIPDSLVQYQLKFFSFNPAQHIYDRYRQGLIPKEEFEKRFAQLKYDSSQVKAQFFKHTTYALAGINEKGQKIIVFDLDQNLDFSNDQILRFDTAFYSLSKEEQHNKEKNLPELVFQYEQIDLAGSVQKKNYPFLINPYKFYFNYPNEMDRRLELMYSHNRWKKAVVKEGSLDYTLLIQNSVTLPAPNRGANVKLIFPHQKDEIGPDDYYKLKDTLLIGHQRYVFKGVSPFSDTLWLEKLASTDRPLGHRAGFYAKDVQLNFLDGNSISLYDLLKKISLSSWIIGEPGANPVWLNSLRLKNYTKKLQLNPMQA